MFATYGNMSPMLIYMSVTYISTLPSYQVHIVILRSVRRDKPPVRCSEYTNNIDDHTLKDHDKRSQNRCA